MISRSGGEAAFICRVPDGCFGKVFVCPYSLITETLKHKPRCGPSLGRALADLLELVLLEHSAALLLPPRDLERGGCCCHPGPFNYKVSTLPYTVPYMCS